MNCLDSNEFGKVRNLNDIVRELGTRFYPVRSGAVRYKVLVMAGWQLEINKHVRQITRARGRSAAHAVSAILLFIVQTFIGVGRS